VKRKKKRKIRYQNVAVSVLVHEKIANIANEKGMFMARFVEKILLEHIESTEDKK